MSIGAELGQYILQTHNSKKLWKFIGGWTSLTPSGYRQWTSGSVKYYITCITRCV